MQYLRGQYDQVVAKMPPDMRKQLLARGVDGFVAFCDGHFAANPAVQTFFPDIGVGVVLQNQTRIIIRGADTGTAGVAKSPAGDTVPSRSIEVTRPQQVEGRHGDMQASGAIEITTGSGIGDGSLPPR
jgi:hypothetical protein